MAFTGLARVGDRAHLTLGQSGHQAGDVAVGICGTVWTLREGVGVDEDRPLCADCAAISLEQLVHLMESAFEHAYEVEQRVNELKRLLGVQEVDL